LPYDFVVIGGGSAGYAAARTALAHGAKVAVIDGSKELGGLCILRGCMPTKALLESSQRWQAIRHARQFGLRVKPLAPDLKAIQARKDFLINDFASYRQGQLTKGKFDLIRGYAAFIDAHTVEVTRGRTRTRVAAKNFLISTGSVVTDVDLPGLRETGYITSDEAIRLAKLPKRLIVLGGGVVAVELGQYFAQLGSKTTILQRSGYLVKEFGADVSTVLEDQFREDGMTVHCNTQLVSVRRTPRGKEVTYRHEGKTKRTLGDEIFYALGRRPAIDGLQLDQAGVVLDGNRVKVDATLRTSQPHIFAAGDVTALYEVVHTAIAQAEIAATNAVTGGNKMADYRLKTTVVFTEPEIASVGQTEDEVKQSGTPYFAASYPFADHGKSMIHGSKRGFVKLIAERTRGEILGAQIIGPHASDLIHELISVMYYHGTAAELAAMPHYHPTLSEIITYPAEDIADAVKALPA
jgi:pyruvate/2-oxoglutarate dehydrogenase complex dihydrolipoamide dehydrogenase (E3) component